MLGKVMLILKAENNEKDILISLTKKVSLISLNRSQMG
jgi:hypothetical protein